MNPREMTLADLAAQPVEIDRIEQLETALDDIRDACGREGSTMTPSEVSQLAVERIATLEHQARYCADEIKQALADLAAELERSAAWEQTAQQESRNRDYYRGLLVATGEKFGVSARTQDDGGVVEDVLVAKVPELVEELRERSAMLAAVLDHPRVWEYLNECHGGKMAPAILAAHDAEVERKAKVEALEEVEKWIHPGGHPMVTLECIHDRIAALKAEGGQG